MLSQFACSGGGNAKPAFLFDRRSSIPVPTRHRRSRCAQWRGREERSHPEPRAARSFARAWRAPDLPRSEHRGTLRTSRRIRPSPLHSTYKRWTERLRRVVPDRAIRVVGGQVYPVDPAGMRWPVGTSTKGDHHVAITSADDRRHDPGRPGSGDATGLNSGGAPAGSALPALTRSTERRGGTRLPAGVAPTGRGTAIAWAMTVC
jgi:hypothetical protein